MEKQMTETQRKEEAKALALQEAMSIDAFGPSPMSSKDIVIPRLQLMQPGSELVTQGEAAFGEFRCSMTGRKLGDLKQGFEVVPIHMKKTWVEYDATNPAELKFLRQYAVDFENENLRFDDEEKLDNGAFIKVKRDMVMDFYVLLSDDIKKGGEIPYILSFRRMSLRSAKKLATQMYVTNRAAKLPPTGRAILVVAKREQNDKGTWAIPDFVLSDARLSNESELLSAFNWFKVITSGKTKDDVPDEVKPVAKQVSKEVNNHAPMGQDLAEDIPF